MDYQNMFAVCMRLTLHYFILLWQTNSTSGLAEAEFVTASPDVTIYTQVQCLGNEWAGRFIFTVYLHVCTMYIGHPAQTCGRVYTCTFLSTQLGLELLL